MSLFFLGFAAGCAFMLVMDSAIFWLDEREQLERYDKGMRAQYGENDHG